MRFSRNPLFVAFLHLVIGATLYACSEDEDGGLTEGAGAGKGTGGRGGTGSTTTTGGTTGSSTGGSTSSSTGGTSTVPSGEACKGLPLDEEPSDGSGGMPSTGSGGDGGGAGI